MTPVIQQTVRFRTTPHALFEMYLDSKKHSKSTGMTARVSRKAGGRFRAFAVDAGRKESADRYRTGRLCSFGGPRIGRKRIGRF